MISTSLTGEVICISSPPIQKGLYVSEELGLNMSSIAYRLGEITATEIIPAIIGLFIAYKLLKYWKNKKNIKQPTNS